MGLIEAIGGRRTYLDANIFIYVLEAPAGYGTVVRLFAQSLDRGEVEAATSELTLAEVLVKPLREAPAYVPVYQQYLRSRPHFEVIPVTHVVLMEAARLRASTNLKLPDAIHAATAIQHGCTVLLTNDTRIRLLPGLDVLYLSDYAGP